MEQGDEWIYRLKDTSPSERVRILDIQRKKTSFRADVEFLDDSGRSENVPGARLRRPWSEVVVYDELMTNWQRLGEYELTEVEESAVEPVFIALIPDDVASWEWSPVRYATAVHDGSALELLIGTSLDELRAGTSFFDLDGVLMLSPEATLRICESACRAHPAEIIAWVMAEEEEIREKCKRGGRIQSSTGRVDSTTSPEREYQWYLKYHKPLHELLRQWCGHRAVTFHERLTAAEAEVRRLDVLVARLIDSAREKGDGFFADVMEEEHNKERITPERARPVVDRPLSPHEIPVREVPTRRRWGY